MRAEQMEEEPSTAPLSETYKRREAERVYEAVQRAHEIGQSSAYKRKESMVDPERRTKQHEDPREVAAREEREEVERAQRGLEALGKRILQETATTKEARGTKGKHEHFAQ